MRGRGLRFFFAPVALVALAAMALVACGDDDDGASEGVSIANAHARFSKVDLGGVFLEITGGDEDDELVSASSGIAGMVEVHETLTEGASSTMQEVEGIAIPAGETVEFAPGGYHIMLMDVTDLPAEGDTFEVELTFTEAGTVTVDVTVDSVPSGDDTGGEEDGDDHTHADGEEHEDGDH